MGIKDKHAFYKEQMKKRHQQNYANRENSGKFRDFFNPLKKVGVPFWKCKEDDHELYIIPYITGGNHPTAKEGELDFVLDIFVHRGIGANEDSFICVNRTYGKSSCPICKHQSDLRKGDGEADDATIKSLNPTRRNVFNIVCLDSSKEEEKGIQVWDVSHYLFTLPVEELAHKKKGGGEILYADHEQGKIISFRRKGSGKTTEFTAFEFKDREALPIELIEQAYCLDEMIHVPTEEEVYAAFWGEDKSSGKEEDVEETHEEVRKEKPTSLRKEPEKEAEKATECPYGAAFGADFGQYEECDACVANVDCKEIFDEAARIEEDRKRTEEAEKKKAATPGKRVLTRRGR